MEISRSINQALIQSSISLDRIPWIAEDLNKFVGCLGAVSHAPDACQMLAYSGSSEEWPDTVAWVLGVSDFSAAFLWTWSAAERRIVEVGAMINSSELELLPLPRSYPTLSRALGWLRHTYRQDRYHGEFVERIPVNLAKH